MARMGPDEEVGSDTVAPRDEDSAVRDEDSEFLTVAARRLRSAGRLAAGRAEARLRAINRVKSASPAPHRKVVAVTFHRECQETRRTDSHVCYSQYAQWRPCQTD
jgi:hypothetical protein